jgi:hypothetical protein
MNFVASANTTSTPAATMVVTLPSHSEGDVIILSFVHNYNSAVQVLTAVSEGYTELASLAISGLGHQASIWYKKAGASEVNPTATYSASSQIIACTAASYTGVDDTVQIDVGPSLWTTEDPGDTTVIAPSVTTTLDGAMLVTVATADDNDVFTQPSGMTLVDNLEFNSMTIASAYELISTAGTTGDKTWTFAQTTDEITAVSFALRPAVDGGLTLVVPSIESLEAFGTPNIRRAQEVLTVESIQSLEAFGTPSLTIISTIAVPSIDSEEEFGLPNVELTSLFISVDSISTEEEFGTPTIIVGETLVLPVSIASAEAFGTPNVTSIGIVTQHLTVATIFSEEEFGVPDVSLFDKHLLVVSIQSGEEFGKPKILGGVQVTNTLNIPEVTLNQISDANHAINIVGNDIGNARRSVYQSAVVRVIDHDDDDATAVDDPTRMALFESKAHGQPWNKYKGHGEHSIHSGSVIETETNMNQIFPTFEYDEFK